MISRRQGVRNPGRLLSWRATKAKIRRNGAGQKPTGSSLQWREWFAVTDKIEDLNANNRVEPSSGGGFVAFWKGSVVYENGRVKRFGTEGEAWEFLALCDAAGKIIH